jgi:hypothetical protein
MTALPVSIHRASLTAKGAACGRPAVLAARHQIPTVRRASKVYRCTICGASLTNEPKPVLQHQMSHVRRRPFAKSAVASEADQAEGETGPTPYSKPS